MMRSHKEIFGEVSVLMSELEGKDKILSDQTDRLYRLNNEIFPHLKEWNKACSACRGRIYNRLKDWWRNNS